MQAKDATSKIKKLKINASHPMCSLTDDDDSSYDY